MNNNYHQCLLVSYFIFELLISFNHKGDDIAEAISYPWEWKKICDADIEDIYDGAVFLEKERLNVLGKNSISLQHNMDGVSVYKSSGKDVWPIFLQINELPPYMRYFNSISIIITCTCIMQNNRKKVENMVLAGLWFGEGHPVINTFMKPIYTVLSRLQESGIAFKYGFTIIIHYFYRH